MLILGLHCSAAHAKSALTALQWSCIAASHCEPVPLELLRCQAVLLGAIPPLPPTRALHLAAHKGLQRLWSGKEGLAAGCLATIVSHDPQLCFLALLGPLSKFVSHEKDSGRVEALLQYFSKTVLASRSTPAHSVVVSVCVCVGGGGIVRV